MNPTGWIDMSRVPDTALAPEEQARLCDALATDDIAVMPDALWEHLLAVAVDGGLR